MLIRNATIQDAEEILSIYAPYILNTAITFEYEVPSLDEFRNRIETISRNYPYLVLIDDSGKMQGYAYASPLKGRKAYEWSCETSIYISSDSHLKGYGKKLYEALEQILVKQNITNMNACIAYNDKEDSYLNHDSPKFHKKMGFQFIGVFHQCAYKFNHWYDMIWMEKMIAPHQENMEPFIPYYKLK